jgi:type IV secretion system protein VirB10
MVTSDIYDSLTSQVKVIPAGSKINLKYNSAGVAMGQTRIGLVATRLIRPDGSYINLGAMTGVDDIGQSGLEDEVNTHFWRLLSTGLLISELTVGVQNQSNGGGIVSMVGQNGQTTYQNAAGQVLLETAKEAMKPYSVSRPTLIIQEGFPMNIMVNRDLLF